jgi:hypothetical protein
VNYERKLKNIVDQQDEKFEKERTARLSGGKTKACETVGNW